MAANWMRSKLTKLKAQNADIMADLGTRVEVSSYGKRSRASSKHAMRALPDKQELQGLVQNYAGKVKKYQAGYALYGRNTFAKRSGVCSRGTWG